MHCDARDLVSCSELQSEPKYSLSLPYYSGMNLTSTAKVLVSCSDVQFETDLKWITMSIIKSI